jgi:hypothetical protein
MNPVLAEYPTPSSAEAFHIRPEPFSRGAHLLEPAGEELLVVGRERRVLRRGVQTGSMIESASSSTGGRASAAAGALATRWPRPKVRMIVAETTIEKQR